jgi:hypothetical protein
MPITLVDRREKSQFSKFVCFYTQKPRTQFTLNEVHLRFTIHNSDHLQQKTKFTFDSQFTILTTYSKNFRSSIGLHPDFSGDSSIYFYKSRVLLIINWKLIIMNNDLIWHLIEFLKQKRFCFSTCSPFYLKIWGVPLNDADI